MIPEIEVLLSILKPIIMFIERAFFEKKMQYIIMRLDKIDKTLVSMAK
jgi:hypothetical protein